MKLTKNDNLSPELPNFFQELTASPKIEIPDVSRRQFFKISTIAGGGLALGLAMGTSPKAKAQAGAAETSSLSPYVQLQP